MAIVVDILHMDLTWCAKSKEPGAVFLRFCWKIVTAVQATGDWDCACPGWSLSHLKSMGFAFILFQYLSSQISYGFYCGCYLYINNIYINNL